MQHIMKRERWQCAAASWAMALDLSLNDFFDLVGHDGSEVIFPHLPEPMRRRGHHHTECVQVARGRGYSATPLDIRPAIQSTDGGRIYYLTPLFSTFDRIILTRKGVLQGRGAKCAHAVAFCEGVIHDPDGESFKYTRQECESRGFYGNLIWDVRNLGQN